MAAHMGDRGGGREGKKKSLNKVKQAKFKTEKDMFKDKRDVIVQSLYSLPPHAFTVTDDIDSAPSSDSDIAPMIDCHIALLSRVFAVDMITVIRRALASNVRVLIAHVPDISRCTELVQLTHQYPHTIYAIIGISPDLIKKTNDKIFDSRLELLNITAMENNVIAIECGLDMSRDVSTHYLQYKSLYIQLQLAIKIRLPIIIHDKLATDKIIEKLEQIKIEMNEHINAYPLRVAISSFNGSDDVLAAYLQADCYIMINGTLCDLKMNTNTATATTSASASASASATAVVPPAITSGSNDALADLSGDGATLFRQLRNGLLPLNRLLISSDSPLCTPQTIDDVFVRQSRNEPANLPYIYAMVSKALRVSETEVRRVVYQNAITFFALKPMTQEELIRSQTEAKTKVSDTATSTTNTAPTSATTKPSSTLSATNGTTSLPHTAAAEKDKQVHFAAGVKDTVDVDERDECEDDDNVPKSQRRRQQTLTATVADEEDDDDWNTKKKSAGKKRKGKSKGKEMPSDDGNSNEHKVEDDEEQEDDDDEEGDDDHNKDAATASSKNKNKARGFASYVGDVDANTLTYACKKCRTVLFTENDLIHHKGAQQATDDTTAEATAEMSRLNVRKSKKDSAPWERTHCETLFVKPLTWMTNLLSASSNSQRVITSKASSMTSSTSSALVISSDRVECPECQAKLGRCSMLASLVPCSCGRFVDGPPPFFAIQAARVDALVYDDAYVKPRSMTSVVSAYESERSESDRIALAAKKDRDRLKKESKRVKKQQKEDQRGNFTEFRNKNMIRKKGADNEEDD